MEGKCVAGGFEEVLKIMTYPDLLATLCPVILMVLCWSCQEEYTNQSLALRGVITPETPSHTEQCKESSHTHTAKVKNKTPHTYIPSARDGSVTIGKQRLLVTENELGLGLKRGVEEVLGLLAGLQSE